MQTKNLTPFLVGTKVTSRRPRKLEMTLVVRGRFHLRPGEALAPIEGVLAQGALSADTFAEGDDERAGELITPSDFADFKVRADVLLRGTCHAPGKRLATECAVTFGVGAWSKSLRVVGRRVWTEKLVGPAISEPAPFVSMPLGFAQAFGGPEFPENPVGRGFRTQELPSIEMPDAPVRSRAATYEPASFSPINPAWPQRSGKVGKEYGESYRKTRAPFYAEDFDWSYFNAAPPDQQVTGYLRGDEALVLVNLHAEAARIETALPGLRIRALVKDRKQQLADVAMRLDTLFVEPDEARVTLTWRGLTEVAEDDLSDVQTVLVASERIVDRPNPTAHYQAILEAFEADPLEKDRYLTPEMKEATAAAKGPDGQPRSPADTLTALLRDRIAAAPPEERPRLEAGLAQFLEQSKQAEARFQGQANDTAKAAVKMRASIAERMKQIPEQIEKLKKVASPADRRDVEELEAMLLDPRFTHWLHPSEAEPGPGADLTGADLSLHDLAGRDLSGANLAGARLLNAKLGGARLAGANLSGALLLGADLTGADLTDADLSKCLLCSALLEGARLDRARLDCAFFDQADLTGATLDDAKGSQVMLGSATLRGAKARRIALHKAMSFQGDLEGLDLTEASLELCVFGEASAQRICLTGARLPRTSFAGSDLRGGTAGEIAAPGSVWLGAVLDGVDFGHSSLPDAHFMNASAKGARFFACVLRRANFYRADLARADLGKADLLRANLNKTGLAGARFGGASLYEASFLGASGDGCDFAGANLARVRFDER